MSHEQKLLTIHQRHLEILKNQAKFYGAAVPPHIQMGIEHEEAQIAKIKGAGQLEELVGYDEILAQLRDLVAEHGCQRKAAKALHVSVGYLSNVLTGAHVAGPAILDTLGYERVIVYRRK